MSDDTKLLPCPGCAGNSTRVIGGPGTAGGPKYWAGCDHCHWRTWGDTEAEAIAAWNTRLSTPDPALVEELQMAWTGLAEYSQSDFVRAASGEHGENLLNKIVGLLSRAEDAIALRSPAAPAGDVEGLLTAQSALDQKTPPLAIAVEQAIHWFEDYERQHRAKRTTEGELKADTNAERAAYLRAALTPLGLEVRAILTGDHDG